MKIFLRMYKIYKNWKEYGELVENKIQSDLNFMINLGEGSIFGI